MATNFEMSRVESCEAVITSGGSYLHFEDRQGNTVALEIGNSEVATRMAEVWQDAKYAGEV